MTVSIRLTLRLFYSGPVSIIAQFRYSFVKMFIKMFTGLGLVTSRVVVRFDVRFRLGKLRFLVGPASVRPRTRVVRLSRR